MTNVSVRVKQRKSIVENKEAPLFIQVIAGRKVRRVPLDWRLTAGEWDGRLERVRVPPGTSLKTFLKGRKTPIRGIDSTLVGEYEAHLIARGLASNTVSFYLRTMRAV